MDGLIKNTLQQCSSYFFTAAMTSKDVHGENSEEYNNNFSMFLLCEFTLGRKVGKFSRNEEELWISF